MKNMCKNGQLRLAALLVALALANVMSISSAYAQGTPIESASLSESTIKNLQEALNKQGVAVKIDGYFTQETREAVRRYQSQHHLPVTGEADQATLQKLGIGSKSGNAADTRVTIGQAATPPNVATPSPQMPSPEGRRAMMSGPMQGMMQGMMTSMQGMMGMMGGQPQQMQPGSMPQSRQGQPQDAMAMNCPMMTGQSGAAMMQMMQGMMQMMQAMQSQMQSAPKQ